MIESTSNKLSFVIGETPVFPFNIRFFKPEDIKCYIQSDGVERMLNAREFSIENKSEYDHGANITLLMDPLPVGATLIIIRECEIVQDVSFPINGKFPSKGNENALDKLTMIAQQQAEQISRCLKSSVGNASPDEIVENISKNVTAAQRASAEATKAGEAASAAAAEAVKAAKDAIEAAGKAQSFGGTSIGSFITSPSPIPPPGAYRLNGQTIACGEELYRDFFEWVTTSGVRIIDNDTYESELTETGVCGGFVVTGTSVRLPSNTKGTLWGSDEGNGGQSFAAGLPNITGDVGVLMTGGGDYNKGAFQTTDTAYNWYGGGSASVTWADFDASRCNDAYGAADTVQPTATGVYFYIQVYGAATKLGEQESAQLASEMQFKAQTDLGNVTANLDFIVEHWEDGNGGWYDRYRSGKLEQGGIFDYGSYALYWEGIVTLWKSFANDKYSVLVSWKDGGTNEDSLIVGGISASKYTQDGFSIFHQGAQDWRDNARYVVWRASGKAETE